MKHLLTTAATVAAVCLLGGVAQAQTATGTIGVTGTVTAKCVVITGGPAGGSTFGGTINLGTLNASDGTLLSTLTGATPVAGATSTFQVNCSGTKTAIDLSATRMNNPAGATEAGYSANIDYTTDAKFLEVGGGSETFNYTTAASAPLHTTATLANRLANSVGDVTVDVRGLSAENGFQSILEAGTFTGTITLLISPTT